MVLSDTAGLRTSDDPVEQEGIALAYSELKQANAVIVVLDVHNLSDNQVTDS